MGHAIHACADRRHRGGIAQPAELRSGPGDLHVRDYFCDLGCGLSLQRMARQTSHAALLDSWLGDLQTTGNPALEPEPDSNNRSQYRCTELYPKALAPALVDAPVSVLGLCARSGYHLSAGL